jgi:pimeloyl-ACP methyl ester carboxylesterase
MSSTASGSATAGPPIVLIHGMWMTPRSWDGWIDRYADRGYRAIAPGWPGIESPEQVRRDPSPLRGLGIKTVVDHYEQIIRGLDRPPIIIGHSFGGLFTQLLLDRGLGVAGVAIGTGAPKGIAVLPVSTLRAAFPALKNPFDRNGLCPLTEKQFHYRFTNTLGRDESDAIYAAHYIPGTNRAFFEAAFANMSRHSPAAVNYSNPARPPLLLIAGGEDHISPLSVNRKLLKLQSKAPSATALKDKPGRPHFMAGLDRWEELADEALDWSLEHAGASAAPSAVEVPEAPATSPM